MIDASALAGFELFRGAAAGDLGRIVARLRPLPFAAGDLLLRQGELDNTFLILVEGTVQVIRHDPDGDRPVAVCGPGSMLGELSLLRGVPRSASAAAATGGLALAGDHGALDELLSVDAVHESISETTARRLAELSRPVAMRTEQGAEITLRPLLRSDRSQFAARVRSLLPESRRRRFFTSGPPSERTIDLLVNIDYVDHFAWTAAVDGRGLGSGRYVRSHQDPDHAEVAFGIIDEFHGHGLGTMLLGALGAAAVNAGIEVFTAEVLDENVPMRRVFDKAAAVWSRADSGVIAARMEVEATRALITAAEWDALAAASRDIVTAAGTALAHPGRDTDSDTDSDA